MRMTTAPRRMMRRALAAILAGVLAPLLAAPPAMAAAPTISSFMPTSGVVGATVTISGTGFQDSSVVTAVAFDGVAATFTVDSNVQITATVPAMATTGPITVTDAEGVATSGSDFTVMPSPTPTITSFAPTSGVAGATVTITGTGFTGASAVRFNGVTATFSVVSDTQITATVPAAATTGPITVTTPGGTATSSADFTVEREAVRHDRSVRLDLKRHLVARGRVSSAEGVCASNVLVKLQRRKAGRWRTVESTQTNASGGFRERLPDRPGRYRALVPKLMLGNDICARDVSPIERHRH